jgi:hypothetical protein
MMLHPKTWLDAVRIREAIRNYPVYTPPHRKDSESITFAEGNENFAFFIDQKPIRLANFVKWLAYFGVSPSDDDMGIHNVGAWVHRNGGLLMTADIYMSNKIYSSFTSSWTENYRGLNVIWDLAIYAGDWIIQKNASCSWGLDIGDEDRASRTMMGYLRPCVLIQEKPGRFPIFDFCFDLVVAKRDLITIGAVRIGDPNMALAGFETKLRNRASQL